MADTTPRRRRSTQPPADRPPMPEDKGTGNTQTQPEQPKVEVRAPGRSSKMLQTKLEQFFAAMALPMLAAGDTHCAGVIVTRGPIVAEAWANLAAESPAVKRVLEGMLKGGAWAGAISSTVMLVVPIAAHHGAPIPDPITAMILGQQPQPSQQQPTESHDVHSNGSKPAATSTDKPNPADPTSYAGVYNAPSTN